MPDDSQNLDQMAGDGPDQALLAALGDGRGALSELGVSAIEVAHVGLETVVGQPVTIASYQAALTDYDAISAEWAAIEHLGFELRVALSETEVLLAGLLVPLHGADLLFGVDTSPEQMQDAAFAAAQSVPISSRLREFLDLVSLALFTAGLTGTEVTVSELRHGQPDWTMGMLQDVAQGSPPVRIDLMMSLENGGQASATLVLPLSLALRFAEELRSSTEPASSATVAEEPALAGAAFEQASNVTMFPGVQGFAAEFASEPAEATPGVAGSAPVHPVRFPPLPPMEDQRGPSRPIDILMDVSMRVSVELGRSSLTVEEVLELGPGSVVELNKLAGEPVDILVNDRLIARGEVVVVDENFGVRITEIISPRQRANAMGR